MTKLQKIAVGAALTLGAVLFAVRSPANLSVTKAVGIRITTSAGGCSIAGSSGSVATACSRNGTGDYTITLATGLFAAMDACSCAGLRDAAGGNIGCQLQASNPPTTTSVRVLLWQTSGTFVDTFSAQIICVGR